jgi:DNA-binding LacI/PurR family transcriptional regulator
MRRPKVRRLRKREEVTRLLAERLETGACRPGDLLPSERSLAEEFKVSRPTLRKALEPFVASGKLIRLRGIGTRVATPRTAAGKSNWRTLGLVLPDIASRFFSEVAEAIEYAALQRGYQILLCNSRRQPAVEEMHIRQLVSRGVDGVLLAHDPHTEFPSALRLLQESGTPVVSLFGTLPGIACDSVTVDDESGVNQVMRYLFSLGHRQIAYCRPVPGSATHPRELAYRRFLDQNRHPVRAEYFVSYESLDDRVFRASLESLFGLAEPPTALFAGNDQTALVALKHLGSMGIRVPDQISVAGFDNLRFTAHLSVPLTTVDQPKQAMGRRAAELLFEHIELGGPLKPRTEVFEPHLVIRDSCAMAAWPTREDATGARLVSCPS